mmetsp:Transcript_3780/g.8921  ORF Transcript_3780/g.8921 Transcript_3780/m.8921 type:complete len:205 (-) Transcript_3780:441-1055(-)
MSASPSVASVASLVSIDTATRSPTESGRFCSSAAAASAPRASTTFRTSLSARGAPPPVLPVSAPLSSSNGPRSWTVACMRDRVCPRIRLCLRRRATRDCRHFWMWPLIPLSAGSGASPACRSCFGGVKAVPSTIACSSFTRFNRARNPVIRDIPFFFSFPVLGAGVQCFSERSSDARSASSWSESRTSISPYLERYSSSGSAET